MMWRLNEDKDVVNWYIKFWRTFEGVLRKNCWTKRDLTDVLALSSKHPVYVVHKTFFQAHSNISDLAFQPPNFPYLKNNLCMGY